MTSLTFTGVDGITFAAARARLNNYRSAAEITADDIGPFLELWHFSADGLLPNLNELSWLKKPSLSTFFNALSDVRDQWISPDGGKFGFTKTDTQGSEQQWNAFAVAAHKASLSAGISSNVTAQLIGALGEMRSNLYEHSNAIDTGLIAFRARSNTFEFTIADHGIGILRSLKSCGHHNSVVDNGEALRLMLTENISRYGSGAGRGKGFRPLFIGLANLNGALRFRSGDHSLMIEGNGPALIAAKSAQKAEIKGFFASVCCRLK